MISYELAWTCTCDVCGVMVVSGRGRRTHAQIADAAKVRKATIGQGYTVTCQRCTDLGEARMRIGTTKTGAVHRLREDGKAWCRHVIVILQEDTVTTAKLRAEPDRLCGQCFGPGEFAGLAGRG